MAVPGRLRDLDVGLNVTTMVVIVLIVVASVIVIGGIIWANLGPQDERDPEQLIKETAERLLREGKKLPEEWASWREDRGEDLPRR